ncbi:MAG: flagellar basal body-associated FliL family protein [Burkholderiales bacterium]|jgi:flagellar FliL protein|nr:flagellar basal body-associated FliL family protein [Burkholderiales bacterium]
MSADEPVVAAATPPKKGKKKLIITATAALLLCAAGGAAFVFLKPSAQADGEEQAVVLQPGVAPTYAQLDTFVVNLADEEADRFAQVGITLQVDDSKIAEQIKTFMPAVRNGILMILAHKSADELLRRSGKEQLAREIMVSVARTLGIPVLDAAAPASADAPAPATAAKDKAGKDEERRGDDKPRPKEGKKDERPRASVHNPITQVHFSNFIIQ